jgi:hypothetical protein
MDKETIIRGCENWVNNHKDESLLLTYSSIVELLTTLKEQEEEIRLLRLVLDIAKGTCKEIEIAGGEVE